MSSIYAQSLKVAQFIDESKIDENQGRARKLGTRAGVADLLKQYRAKLEYTLVSRLYAGEYTAIEQIPLAVKRRDESALSEVDKRISDSISLLTASDGNISTYIEMNRDQLKKAAVSLANLQCKSMSEKIKTAEAILGSKLLGDTVASQFSRCCNAAFWRRALVTRVARAREQVFLRLGLVGEHLEKYASDSNIDAREFQLRAQQNWMNNTFLTPKKKEGSTDEGAPDVSRIPLVNVIQTPEARFAKLYSFLKAMEILGEESNLSSAMLTITLEPQWHSNPCRGTKKWNGKSPREAHQSFCKRWQAIVRDLHRKNIRLSGLRVVEPHLDACPHYHIWLLYRPEHEAQIMLGIMQYFPDRLKVVTADRSPANEVTHKRVIYINRSKLVRRAPLPCTVKTRSQVEFSKINPYVCKGAGYVTKYLMMTLPVNFEGGEMVGSLRNEDSDSSKKSGSLERVDSYRSIWGMNRGQLFGVAKCLTVWDQLRKMTSAPDNWRLKNLWAKARGGIKEGRIEKGAGVRGDAVAFLKALGGLDAARNGKKNIRRLALVRLVEKGENRHGDCIEQTVGIQLLLKVRRKIERNRDGRNVDNFKKCGWETVTTIIASVKTKLRAWEFVTDLNLSSRKYPKFSAYSR